MYINIYTIKIIPPLSNMIYLSFSRTVPFLLPIAHCGTYQIYAYYFIQISKRTRKNNPTYKGR